MLQIFVIAALIFIDTTISFVCGFGMSTLLIPVLLFWYPVNAVLVLVGLLHLITNLNKSILLARSIDWPLFLWLSVPAIGMSILGAYLTTYIARELFLRILGIVLLIYAINSFSHKYIKFSRKPSFSILAGSLYGFVEGLTGIGGVVRTSLFYGYQLSPAALIATSGFFALIVDIARISTYLSSGLPDMFSWWHYLLFVATATAGSIVGRSLIRVLPAKFIRYLIIAAIALVSLKFIIAP